MRHQRKTLRLKGDDYSQPGSYFVTIVTQERQEVFGRIVGGEVELSGAGLYSVSGESCRSDMMA